MSNPNPTQATVRHTPLKGKTVAQALSDLGTVCTTAVQSPEVQASPVALQALGVLQKAVSTAGTSLSTRQSLALAFAAAIKALKLDFRAVGVATTTYEAAVNAIARGDAAVINRAGLQARDQKTPPAALGKVTGITTKPGKRQTEAIVRWPAAPGATGYAIEVNFTPLSPTGTWTALNSGAGRRRIIKAPTPGAQFLMRVAALGSDGTPSDWSDSVLVTAL